MSDRPYGKPIPIECSKIENIRKAKKELKALQSLILIELWKFEKATNLKIHDIWLEKIEQVGDQSELKEVKISIGL